jgi:UDPglucose 6-dehydrogenase
VTSYSVIGLGKLGACMAAALAARRHNVIGVDVNHMVVEDLAAGRAPLLEPGLQDAIDRADGRLRATTDTSDAVVASDVTFVVVPTPSDPRGAFSTEYARTAFEEIGKGLARKDDYHLVVLTSTVLPGASRYGLLPALETASGKNAGEDFGFCYSPEFIALGSVIRDFLHPDFLLIGEHDDRAGEVLERCYREIIENGAPCKRMSIENAELAKIALNSFVTTKITFANLLAQICEQIPGGDVDAVTDAIGADRRVGNSYLRGGLGFGGPCFPRDNDAFSFLADQLGADSAVPRATDEFNRRVPERIVERLASLLEPGCRVAVVGIAYKPGTAVIDASQGVLIAQLLAREGIEVSVFDPLAADNAVEILAGDAHVARSLDEAASGAHLLVLGSPDRDLAGRAVALAPDAIVFDCWRAISSVERGQRVLAIGRGEGSGGDALPRPYEAPAGESVDGRA